MAFLADRNLTTPRCLANAALLIRDEAGRVLLVNPTYKDNWDLPGGMVEDNEPPRAAGVRELAEELGLTVAAGRVLVLDWVGPHGPWDDQLVFIFDGGTLSHAQVKTIRISDPEIGEFAFVELTEAKTLLRPDMAQRLTRACEALTTGVTDYSEQPG